GVLGVGNAVAADAATGQVGNGRDVTGGPGALDGLLGRAHAEVRTGLDATALLDRQVAAAHDGGVGHHASGPHDQVGRDDLARGDLDVAVDGTGDLGVQVHVRAALGKILQHPLAGLQRHLGHDAAHRLDEVEVGVLEGEL